VFQAESGLATSPVDVAALFATMDHLESETQHNPTQITLLLQDLWFTTQA
jgi:hypothetical protein